MDKFDPNANYGEYDFTEDVSFGIWDDGDVWIDIWSKDMGGVRKIIPLDELEEFVKNAREFIDFREAAKQERE